MNLQMIYIDASRLDEESKTLFAQNHIQVKDYEAIYEDVKTLEGPVLVDGNFVNSKIVYSLWDAPAPRHHGKRME